MKVGTKSILFGAHAFWLHPWFVAVAWWKLYGFPWQPWLWVAFFVHDIGYWGKPNMDGREGETHPYTGAHILWCLQGAWEYVTQFYHERYNLWQRIHANISLQDVVWGNEALYHSRFLAKRDGVKPSRLCMADKLALTLTPWWLYIPMTTATGEIYEYMELVTKRTGTEEPRYARTHVGKEFADDKRLWYAQVQEYMKLWTDEHKGGVEDTWTPNMKAGE